MKVYLTIGARNPEQAKVIENEMKDNIEKLQMKSDKIN